MAITKLSYENMYKTSKLATLEISSTKFLQPLDEIVGQQRARQAIEFAMSIKDRGYNVYAVGCNGLGKRTMVMRYLNQHWQSDSALFDWCYVNNFQDQRFPSLLKLPAGFGAQFQKEIEGLMLKLGKAFPLAFDNDMYYSRAEALTNRLSTQQQTALKVLHEEAAKHNLQLAITTEGEYQFTALNGEKPHTEESFNALPPKTQAKFATAISELEVNLRQLVRDLASWEEQYSEKQQKLDGQITKEVLQYHMAPLLDKYQKQSTIKKYLKLLQEDIIENIDIFLQEQEEQVALAYASLDKKLPRRYQINVLASNTPDQPPIVIEENPSYHNIFGYIENTTVKGTIFTDFSLIRPGSIHRANGGVLLIDAIKVLERPFVWDGLKRALQSGKTNLHSLEKEVTFSSSISLEPEAMPLDVKIILFGDHHTYNLLQEHDPEFSELFRVTADFEDTMARDEQSEFQFAKFISSICHENNLFHCAPNAIARIIEYSARKAEAQNRLSLHSADTINLLRESNYQAKLNHANVISASHVEKALACREMRLSRYRDNLLDNVKNNIILVTTRGKAVGQVNALSVISTHEHSFGMPSRITATTSFGQGELIDIERSVRLGGNIHSKGVMILTAYLSAMLGKQAHIPLTTRLTFEQSYGAVDGDSASIAEFCAVISAITGLPLRQDFALTGSMDQFGQVQPIGGVNEKIEGFFDVCTITGTKASQAVIIPRANMQNLMLRKDIIHAVSRKKFHIYAIDHVSEAIELLTGCRATDPDSNGHFKPGSVYHKAMENLKTLRKDARSSKPR